MKKFTFILSLILFFSSSAFSKENGFYYCAWSGDFFTPFSSIEITDDFVVTYNDGLQDILLWSNETMGVWQDYFSHHFPYENNGLYKINRNDSQFELHYDRRAFVTDSTTGFNREVRGVEVITIPGSITENGRGIIRLDAKIYSLEGELENEFRVNALCSYGY
jgi:hypothetical protein